jgi:hypothetical protein
MDIEYTTQDDLFEIIRKIDTTYYERFNANILYLEELADRIYVIYIIELRDAYSHLARIFDYDIVSEPGRKNVQYHLNEYAEHLRRGLLDTFRKILILELDSLKKSVHKKDVKIVEYEISKKAAELRVMRKDHPVDQRIAGYIKLMEFISDVRKKLTHFRG